MVQGPSRNQVDLGEECAAYGHSWQAGRNLVSDGIEGIPEKRKMKQKTKRIRITEFMDAPLKRNPFGQLSINC